MECELMNSQIQKIIQKRLEFQNSNNSLPQLISLKHTVEEDKNDFITPKPQTKLSEKLNISYESPYIQKKQEIDEIIGNTLFVPLQEDIDI